MSKKTFEEYRNEIDEIFNEIRWINDCFQLIKERNLTSKEKKCEYFYDLLNGLIKQIKQKKTVKGVLLVSQQDKEMILNLKCELWANCSAEYQNEVADHMEDYVSID